MKADQDVIQEIKNGNTSSFAILVERHQKTMMKAALRVTRNFNLSEDIVQESFIKAYQKLDSFEGRSSFRSWMYQITLNTAKNRLRSLKRENVSLENMTLATDSGLDEKLHRLSVFEKLKSEIDDLPEKQRQAISLRIFDDLSFKEIAELMNCPYDTAKANYRHAMLKLKAKIECHPEFQLMNQRGSLMSNELSVVEVKS
ncbi:MAG: sigma-70 family RNA polymerase sigma factor [Bdellovibrionales bacterium]|nr:sigma-70 family RNA polymerase sigma factor [Bdellovibrionales bacterium]